MWTLRSLLGFMEPPSSKLATQSQMLLFGTIDSAAFPERQANLQGSAFCFLTMPCTSLHSTPDLFGSQKSTEIFRAELSLLAAQPRTAPVKSLCQTQRTLAILARHKQSTSSPWLEHLPGSLCSLWCRCLACGCRGRSNRYQSYADVTEFDFGCL